MVALASFDNLPHAEQLAYIRTHREDYLGHLLIGVLSTGIYCLPSCTAREPKPENVRFFKSEAEAQAAGLRACRRCRPDFFYRNYDPDLERLITLVEALRRDPGAFSGLDAMADAFGGGVTKLHLLFRQHYQTTPAAFLNRIRIAAACTQLADPAQQVIDVAYAVGFESLSAFHENFRKATGLSPKDYQNLGKTSGFTILLPANYLPWIALKLLSRDPESLIERVNGDQAIKALHIGTKAVLLEMMWRTGQVECHVNTPLDPAEMRGVHDAVIRMLGFPINPSSFERTMNDDPRLAPILDGRQGLRIPMSPNLFEAITWAIVGQQVNLTFAYKLRRSLAELCGESAGDGFMAHPTPEAIAQLNYEDLTPRQFSRRKAEYLIDTARLLVSGALVLDPLSAASQIEKQLLAVRGLGVWSVNYVMLRAFGFADCVPLGDTGLSTALQRFFQLDHRPDSEEVAVLMKPFAPYRSLATYHLWLSLNPGATPV